RLGESRADRRRGTGRPPKGKRARLTSARTAAAVRHRHAAAPSPRTRMRSTPGHRPSRTRPAVAPGRRSGEAQRGNWVMAIAVGGVCLPPRPCARPGAPRSLSLPRSLAAGSGGCQMSDVTRVLGAIERGDPQAAEQLLPLVYAELRRLAAQKM